MQKISYIGKQDRKYIVSAQYLLQKNKQTAHVTLRIP